MDLVCDALRQSAHCGVFNISVNGTDEGKLGMSMYMFTLFGSNLFLGDFSIVIIIIIHLIYRALFIPKSNLKVLVLIIYTLHCYNNYLLLCLIV